MKRNAISTLGIIVGAFVACTAAAHAQVSGGKGPMPVRWQVTPILQGNCVAYAPAGGRMAIGGAGGVQVMTTSLTDVRYLPTSISGVARVQFSPDGKTLAVAGTVASNSGRLELWNVAARRLIVTLPERTNANPVMAFSPDGNSLAVGGSNDKVSWLKLYDAANFHVVRTYPTYASQVQSIAFSADGSAIALGGATKTGGVLEFWDAASGKITRRNSITGGNFVSAMAFSADGRHFADTYAGKNGISLELRSASGTLLKRLPTKADYLLWDVAFSPDGAQLVAGGRKNVPPNAVLELWDTTTGALIIDLPTAAGSGITGIAWSPNGRKLITSGFTLSALYTGNSAPLEIWNTATHRVQATYAASSPLGGGAVVYSPDGRTVASAATLTEIGPPTAVVQLRDAATGALRENLNTAAANSVNAVAFSRDGSLLACAGVVGSASVLELWDAGRGRLFKSLSSGLSAIRSIAFSPDGRSMAVFGGDSQLNVMIEVWDLTTLTARTIPVGGVGQAKAIVWTLDSQSVVVAGSLFASVNGSGFLYVFDAKSGQLAKSFNFGSTDSVDTLVMSPDGQNVAIGTTTIQINTGYRSGVTIFSLTSGIPVTRVGDALFGFPPAMAYTPRGDILFVGNAAFSTASGRQLFVADNIFATQGLALSPDGLSIAYQAQGLFVVDNPVAYYGLLDALTLRSSSIKAGKSTQATITLASPAPAGGVTVALSCDNIFVTVPPSARVQAGKTTATFEVKVGTNALTSSGTVTASLAAKSVFASLSIP